MEINLIESSNYLSNENKINKKHNKFNEDIMILDKSFYSNENNDNEEKNKDPIFILTIELEKGRIEKLKIYSDSNADNLATNFCNNFTLDEKTYEYLKEKIEYLLNEYKKNKNIKIQKYSNEINNNLERESKEFEIEENKSDYFNNYLDSKNKNKSNKKENNRSYISKGFDINNITLKKNNIIKQRKIIRNNTDKKIFHNIKSTPKSISSKTQSCSKSSIKNFNQISKINDYFLDKNKMNNDKNNSKINTYYNYYSSKSINNIKIDNNLLIPNNKIKNITNRDNKKNINDENYYLKKLLQDNEPEIKSRKKSPYYRSFIYKNESIGKNMTNFDTHSTSKINTDTFITNNTSSRIILDDIKFSKENPIIINDKKINNYGQYLYEKSKITKLEKQNEISKIQRHGAMEEYKLCSFMPKTNIKKTSNIKSKYKDNKKEIKLNEEEFNFKPKINNNYNTDLTFEQRLVIFNNLYKKRNEELKHYFLNSKYDEKGNELFRPKINFKQSYNLKKEEDIDIFNKNYSYYKKYNFNKKQLIKKFYNDNDINNHKICPKEKTEKILNDVYSKVFTKLFNDLDSDQDNLITRLYINTSNIPDSILKIIEPILKELKDDNQTLNCEEFILVMIRLFEDTPLVDKQKLINYYKNKIKIDNKNIKRAQTPNHYTLFSTDNNILKNNSSYNSIFLNKKEKIGINYKNKNLNILEKKYELSDDYNGLNKNKKYDINIKNEVYDGLNPISRYTFNNYLKQVKY